jgi:hypothetical protein
MSFLLHLLRFMFLLYESSRLCYYWFSNWYFEVFNIIFYRTLMIILVSIRNESYQIPRKMSYTLKFLYHASIVSVLWHNSTVSISAITFRAGVSQVLTSRLQPCCNILQRSPVLTPAGTLQSLMTIGRTTERRRRAVRPPISVLGSVLLVAELVGVDWFVTVTQCDRI